MILCNNNNFPYLCSNALNGRLQLVFRKVLSCVPSLFVVCMRYVKPQSLHNVKISCARV